MWKRFTRFPRTHWPIFLFFFPPSLSSVSQPCPHYPFLSSVMVQGLLNILSPRTKFRKCSLSPRPGLMTVSSSHCAGTGIQSPLLLRVLTQRIVKEQLLSRHIIMIHMWACSFVLYVLSLGVPSHTGSLQPSCVGVGALTLALRGHPSAPRKLH